MNYIGEDFYTEEELKAKGFKSLGKNVNIKRNVGIFFCENVSIGDNVRIDDFTIIVGSGEGLVVERNVHLAASCYLVCYAGIRLRKFSAFSPNVGIYSASENYKANSLHNPTVDMKYKKAVHAKVDIGVACLVGANSVILPGVKMEFGSRCGALSLLRGTIPEYELWGGNPPKKIQDIEPFDADLLEVIGEK